MEYEGQKQDKKEDSKEFIIYSSCIFLEIVRKKIKIKQELQKCPQTLEDIATNI